MPFVEWRCIESHLEWVEMPAHSTLCEVGGSVRHVYFPTTAVVSPVSTMLDGATVEVAALGNEGMVVVDAFMFRLQLRQAVFFGSVVASIHLRKN